MTADEANEYPVPLPATHRTACHPVFAAKSLLRDRLQAVVYAYESGLVRPSGQIAHRG
jgi:hypothetical protein